MVLRLIEEFGEGIKEASPSLKKNYTQKFNSFVKRSGFTELRNKSADEINFTLERLYFDGVSISSIRVMAMALRFYFENISKDEEKAQKISYPVYVFLYLNDEEIKHIYVVARKLGVLEYLITRLIIHYGFTGESLLQIKLSDIQAEKSVIRHPEGPEIVLEKNDRDSLLIYLKETRNSKEKLYFLKGSKGKPKSVRSLQQIITTIKNEAGIEVRHTLKAFTDTFLINSLRNGRDKDELIKMGYDRVELTGYIDYINTNF